MAGWLPTAPASEPTASAALLSAGQLAEFQERFGQTVTLAVVPLDGGAATSTPETGSTYAWSTAKPLIIARLLADGAARRALGERASAAVLRRKGVVGRCADTLAAELRKTGCAR